MPFQGTSPSPTLERSYLSSPNWSPLQDRKESARLLSDDSPNEKLAWEEEDSLELDANPFQRKSAGSLSIGSSTRNRLYPVALIAAFSIGALLAYAAAKSPISFEATQAPKPLSIPLTRHESGLVFLDPSAFIRAEEVDRIRSTAEHPILTLVREAEEQWHLKHQRRSKSLEEAVEEYKRRYRRPPPKGFDRWYTFAIENGVIFHDEYDGMVANLEPFWAVSPSLLRQRRERLRTEHNEINHSFTFIFSGGNLTISSELSEDHERIVNHREFCEAFAHQLEDVALTFNFEDRPRVQMDWAARQRHLRAARAGTVLSDEEANSVDDDLAWNGYELACPPDSRLRRAANGLEVANLPLGASFIGLNHVKAMDVCQNPEWKRLHGYTWSKGLRPQPIDPIASFSKLALDSDILAPALEQFYDIAHEDPSWSEKTFNKAVWRGSTTGCNYNSTTPWRSSQRPRLVSLSKDDGGMRRVRFSDPDDRVVERVIGHRELAQRYIDVGFTGELIQCNDDCQKLAKEFEFVPRLSWAEQNDYKYLIDVDGNGWSGRFGRLMRSNSLVLKSTIFAPWYAETLSPWFHYIPLRVDYADLYDIMAFFSGDLNGESGHDELAERIAAQGKQWAEEHFRKEDLQAYMFRLYLELARLFADDRSAFDYRPL